MNELVIPGQAVEPPNLVRSIVDEHRHDGAALLVILRPLVSKTLYHSPFRGPFNAVMSQLHTWLGPCATNSGRTWGGCVAWDRRSRLCWACRAIRYLLGTALLASARGVGYRRIAADLGRAASTVRRWVRSVRDAHAEWLRTQAVSWIDAVDRDVFATLTPSRTRLEDALNAVAAAALAVQAHLAPHVPIWTLIGRVTGWRLVPPGGGG
jgi:transposase-like protein